MSDLEIQSFLSGVFDEVKKKKQIITMFMLTHKRPKFVKLAIDGVLNQSYSNFYLIILDNNSKDETSMIVHSYSDERVIYIERESVPEMPNAQFAFHNYVTKYICVLHDDDILEPLFLEKTLSLMETDESISSVSVCANIIDEEGRIVSLFDSSNEVKTYQGKEYIEHYLRKTDGFASVVYPSAVYRKHFYGDRERFINLKAGPSGDQYLWFQTERQNGKIAIIQEGLINYRVHKSQMSYVQGGTMTIRLLSFLCADPYYNAILHENSKYIGRFIRTYLLAGIELFIVGKFDYKARIDAFKLIDKRYVIRFDAFFYRYLYRIFVVFPRFVSLVYKMVYQIYKRSKTK